MEELFRLIPDKFADVIRARLCADKLCEVRIGNCRPVRVSYDGVYYYLGKNGISKDVSSAFIAQADETEKIVLRACDRSLYTVTETLKRGFIPVSGGLRIGVCGSAVTDKGDIRNIKDYSSVNIRLPHEVRGCAMPIFQRISDGELCNTLLISPPGAGKTTVMRDLCRIISDRGANVLLCDEKYEIASVVNGKAVLDVGVNTDVISGADKRYVFEVGIASMRPDMIVTDELFGADVDALLRAVHCGIAVASTVHARDLDDYMSKPEYSEIIESGVFKRYAVISQPPYRRIEVFDGESAL